MEKLPADELSVRTNDSAPSPVKTLSAYVPGFRTGVWWKAITALAFYGLCAVGILSGLGVGSATPRINVSSVITWMVLLLIAVVTAYVVSLRDHLALLAVLRRWPDQADLHTGLKRGSARRDLKEAERAHRQALDVRDRAIMAARQTVEVAERTRQTAILTTESELTHLRKPGNGRLVGGYKTFALYDYAISTPDGTSPLTAAHASVELSHSQLFLEVNASNVSSVIKCDAKDDEKVRKFAAKINNTAILAARWEERRPGAISRTEEALYNLHNDVAAIERARLELSRVEEDEALLGSVHAAEARSINARTVAEQADHDLESIRSQDASSDADDSATDTAITALQTEAASGESSRNPPNPRARSVPRILVWVLGIVSVVIAFATSMFAFPLTLVGLVLVAAALATDIVGTRSKITRTTLWRGESWLRSTPPILVALALLVWAGTTSALGYSTYKADRDHRAQVAAVAAAAVTRAHATSTAIAVAQATRVVTMAIATKTAAAKATTIAVVAHRARVLAQRTAAPRETATASARAKAKAIADTNARAQAHATAAARATAAAQAQAAANAQATSAAQPSGDTYADVNDHPDAHQGDIVQWTCNVYKFLDQQTLGCWEYTGTYTGGTGDGSIILDFSGGTADASSVKSGDDVRIYGTVEQPAQGTNAFGGQVTSPQIAVKSIADLGHDANASP